MQPIFLRGPFRKDSKGVSIDSRRIGAALLIGLLLVLFYYPSGVGQGGGTNPPTAEAFAQNALNAVLGDLKQEIVAGSNASVPASGISVYAPRTSHTIVPFRAGSNDLLANLVKRSVAGQPFYVGADYDANFPASNRAADASSAAFSLNGRAVSLSRWNRPLLLPKRNPASASDLTPDGSFAAPSWILSARDGSNPMLWSSELIAGGANPVVGRYAYTIYDEGGLLDANVAGYASGTPLRQAAYKSSAAFADLTQLPLTQAQIDSLISWRALHPFVGRQDLINLLTQRIATTASSRAALQNALQYLGTFSRDLNQPSLKPDPARPKVVAGPSGGGNDGFGKDDNINPSFLDVRVQTAFTRSDGTAAIVGEPLVKKRFLLQRLAWLTYKGPSAARTIPAAQPAQANDPDYDMWTLAASGIVPGFLAQGTAANIQKYFGLTWDAAANAWLYNVHNGTGAIKKLADIANDPQRADDPDFVELLQAGINVGSIAKGAVKADKLLYGGVHTQDFDLDTSTNSAILQVAANIIDQYDGDGFPTKLTFAGHDFFGVENLPYVYRVQPGLLKLREASPATDTSVRNKTSSFPNSTEKLADMGMVMVMAMPELWNPHDKDCSPGAPRPTSFGVYAENTAPLSEIWSINDIGAGGSRSNSTSHSSALKFSTGYGGTGLTFPTSPGYLRPAYAENNTLMTFSVPTGNNMSMFREPTLLAQPGKPAGSGLQLGFDLSTFDGGRFSLIARDNTGALAYANNGFLSTTPNPLRLVASEPGYSNTVNADTYIGFISGVYPLRWVDGGNVKTIWTSQVPQNRSVSVSAVVLECKDAQGNWIKYDRKDMSISRSWLYPPLGLANPANNNNANDQSALIQLEAEPNYSFDPRSSHFGTTLADHGNDAAHSGPPGPQFYRPPAKGGWINSGELIRTTDRPDMQSGYGAFGRLGQGTNTWQGQARSELINLGWHVFGPTSDLLVGGGFPRFGLFTQNNPYAPTDGARFSGDTATIAASDAQFYADPDGVVRRAMGGYALADNTVGLPMARAMDFVPENAPANSAGAASRPTQSQSRPWILNRPFRSVGELGYVFSGTPWRNLDLSAPESGFAGLLDVFTLADTPADNALTAAGKVNLNTRQKPVLKALLSGAYKDDKDPSGAQLSSTEAAAVANALYDRTTSVDAAKGPILNISHLIGRWNAKTTLPGPYSPALSDSFNTDGSRSYVGFSDDLSAVLTTDADKKISRFREAAIRPLANLGQTRVWNLLIDLIAQTGSYPAEATGLDQFAVDGEQRYWLHAAIDRYTGEVLDQSLEEVFDAPTDIALSKAAMLENQPAGAAVGSLSAAGPNPSSNFSFALVGGAGSDDNAAFTVSGGALQTAAVFHASARNSYSVRLRASDQDGLSFEKPFTIMVLRDSYTPWKAAYFAGQANDSAVAGDMADPDRDGMPNLLEYPLGKSPTSPDTSGIALQTNGGVATMKYTRLSSATDVTLHAYWTSNLSDPASWSMSNVTETLISDDGTIQHWEASVPINSAQRMFLRLAVTRP